MSSPLTNASLYSPTAHGSAVSSRRPEELYYQGGTVAAILLVLVSLWLF